MALELAPRLLNILACPRDHSELQQQGENLYCAEGHKYPIIEGVPVFLLSEKDQTIGIASASLEAVCQGGATLYLETLGLSDEEKRGIQSDRSGPGEIDPVISYLVGATSGFGYAKLVGRLNEYPIPNIPIGAGAGKILLDVGCSWGRWSVSAVRKGWRVIGIDPSLGAIMAARRAFSGHTKDLSFVCGDARFLPFRAHVFDAVFSYSVLQHFSETDVKIALTEVSRVLRNGGKSKIQMAHMGGLRSTWHRTRSHYAHSGVFRVRYWSLHNMKTLFEDTIGKTELIAEAFGGLGILPEDWKYVPVKTKSIIVLSTLLRGLSRRVGPLIRLADSVYVVSSKSD